MNFDTLSSQFSLSIILVSSAVIDSRKFGRSIFERLLIFKFEMLAILKFDCSKFKPLPQIKIKEHKYVKTNLTKTNVRMVKIRGEITNYRKSKVKNYRKRLFRIKGRSMR